MLDTPAATTTFHPADLEPARAFRRTYVTRRRGTWVDATFVIGLMVVLITLIPFNLIVPGMTDLGRPGLVVGLVLFAWWTLVRFTSHLSVMGPQPMRWAVLIFFTSITASYAAGELRSLTAIESNGANRAMLFFAILCGTALIASDGVPNWLRLRVVLRVVVACCAIMATIGILQFATAFDVVKYINIPGLSPKGYGPGFEVRGAGIRVAATTTHYIELAAVLSMSLPLAINAAMFPVNKKGRRWGVLGCLLITAGILATISRTGIFAIALMLLVLVPVWRWRMRYNVAALGLILLAGLSVIKPSLVVTLSRLFSTPSDNPAFTVRSDRYPLVWHYFYEHPLIGRGTGTFIAPQYQILDNQWLGTLITNGALGVAALLLLHITGMVLAGLAMRRATTPADRHLCAALLSTQLIAIGVAGTFDSLSFSTYAMIMALCLGLCGTVWRLTHPVWPVRTSTTRWYLKPRSPRRAVQVEPTA